MKTFPSVIFILFFIIPFAGTAQDLTGWWKGSSQQESTNFRNNKYNFQVYITHGVGKKLTCTTYSSNADTTNPYYGKAAATGIFNKDEKTVVIIETSLEEVKTNPDVNACLMACSLTYQATKNGDELNGTYTSLTATKEDCGGGTVFLERMPLRKKRK